MTTNHSERNQISSAVRSSCLLCLVSESGAGGLCSYHLCLSPSAGSCYCPFRGREDLGTITKARVRIPVVWKLRVFALQDHSSRRTKRSVQFPLSDSLAPFRGRAEGIEVFDRRPLNVWLDHCESVFVVVGPSTGHSPSSSTLKGLKHRCPSLINNTHTHTRARARTHTHTHSLSLSL